MELRHLRYFTAVARHRSYSEASRNLHIAQPAVSQAILDLESELGVKLLSRTRRSVRLTVAGEVFLREAEEILRHAAGAALQAQRAARGEVGALKIGFFGSATAPFLPELVRKYRQQFPGVELQLYELTPEQQVRAFDEGRIDLAFTRLLPPERGEAFHQETVYSDFLAAALPEGHALARQQRIRLKDLATESFVQFHRQGAPRLYDEVLATCRQAGFSPRVISEPDFMATVITLVESGLGVSLVPSNVRSLNRPQVVIRPITPKSSKIPLCMTWPQSNDNPALEAFIKTVQAERPAIQKRMETGF